MLLWHPEALVKCIRLEEHVFVAILPLPLMHKLHFPFVSILLKEKSDGVKIVPIILAREPHFMVSIEVVENVLQVITDNRTEI